MAPFKRRRRMPAPLAEDPLADDRGLAKRKLRQLCRQVERAVSTALGDDVADEVLLDLIVTTVLPWPNASRLLVVVEPTSTQADIDRSLVLQHLADAKAELRAVIAGAINRKRTPEICFEVFMSDAVEDDSGRPLVGDLDPDVDDLVPP